MQQTLTSASSNVPDWDMTPYFETFDGTDYQAFHNQLASTISNLQKNVFQLITEGEIFNPDRWADILTEIEEIGSRVDHFNSYLICMEAANFRNEAVQHELSAMSVIRASANKILAAVRTALRDLPDCRFEQLLAHPKLRGTQYFLECFRQSGRWSMSPELEALAAELEIAGLSAWERLYNSFTDKLEFEIELPSDNTKRLPVSMRESLLEDSDPIIRQATFKATSAVWESSAEVMAACLNAISGTRLALYKQRGIPDFLEPALFDAGITKQTLETMLDVVRDRREVLQNFLHCKAEILGGECFGFQDVQALLPFQDNERISWDDACQSVLETFYNYYPNLGNFAAMALRKRWVDYQPRPGKLPGSFCSTSILIRESRICLNYNGTLGDRSILAHELGHAFHAWLMRDLRPWSRRYPMTLAETASIFAEQLAADRFVENASSSGKQQAVLLNKRLSDASLFLLNIPMRFDFEKAVYEERSSGELSISRFKELMLEAQKFYFGGSLDENWLDPWYWASKSHFYSSRISFYNFPYTFGYLFSQGLFARFKQEGSAFLSGYETFLRASGSNTVENCAWQYLGIDLKAPDFWNATIDAIAEDVNNFKSAIACPSYPRAF
jgi:oligoendopeptidase F